MPYVVEMGGTIIGTMSRDGKVTYDNDVIKSKVQEMIAGQQNSGKGSSLLRTNVRVTYKFDKNRASNNDAIYKLWKDNPLVQNRIRQVNALVFGRGFSYAYDETTQKAIDRFWRVNRLKQKLNPMMTDAQLYGDCFIGLFPQKSGDVLVSVYESSSVDIDFDPSSVDIINQYIVSYKNEETNKDEQITFLPAYQYLNNIEFATPIGRVATKIRNQLGMGKTNLQGHDGLMIHVKFNNSSCEVYGTSDFRQSYGVVNDYMDFRSDRMSIHQMYGSPMFDITIETDDPNKITERIDELAGFTIGSNPVHNSQETWKPLEFVNNADSAEHDEKAMRGLICAGFGMPEHMVFNQSNGQESQDGTFALNKMAEDMQDSFGDAMVMMHKIAVATSGGDISKIDEGQIVFPEISTMSEKAKAETYVLKVGAQICSRETASYNTGHNWVVEETKIIEEMDKFSPLASTASGGGIMGGRFSSKVNNQDPNRDDGTQDRKDRMMANNIKDQTFGNRKQNN